MRFFSKLQHQLANRNRWQRLSTSLAAAALMLSLAGAPAVQAGDAASDHDAKQAKEEKTAAEKAAADQGGGQGATESPGGSGPQWLRSMGDNLRLNVDAVSRFDTKRGPDAGSTLNTVGLDVHTVMSNGSGNVGVFVLQPYLVRRDNARPVMMHMEGPNDWEVELHDFYFNVTRWGRGRTNIKFGHFDVPFGLEPNTDTHFKIYQLIPMENLGMKKDWGVSLNGGLPKFDYEVALTRGSGFQYRSKENNNYAVSARIGTPSDRNFVLGVAVLQGRVLNPRLNVLIPRKRAGLDASWIVSQFTLKGEASLGKDFNDNVYHNLLELDWVNPAGTLSAYVQGVHLRRKMMMGMGGMPGMMGDMGMMMMPRWRDKVAPRVGANWWFSKRWSVEGQFGPEMVMPMTQREDWEFRVQLRYLH